LMCGLQCKATELGTTNLWHPKGLSKYNDDLNFF